MHIAIIYSLPTRRAIATPYKATDEDTKDSAEEVASALAQKGLTPALIPISEDTIDEIALIKADVIYNLIEWDGFDTPLTLLAFAYLESTGIPYTGPMKEAVAVCNDKVKMKKALDTAGLPTPAWQVFDTGDEPLRPQLRLPVIIKLAQEHCSVGLTKDAVVSHAKELHAAVKERITTFHQPVYVEEFIDGRELQVTVLEQNKKVRILPPAEIVFKNKGTTAFLTYDSRWNEDHPEYAQSTVIKAKLSPSRIQKLYRIAHKTFAAFNFHDYARLDIRLRDDDIFILEANANPGLSDHPDYGMTVSYKAAGMSFSDFCWEIVQSSMRRSHNATK